MSLTQHTVDVVVRALKTFVQAFLATWGITGYGFSKDALVAAAAAGISAVWSVAVKLEAARSQVAVTPTAAVATPEIPTHIAVPEGR